jgi:hypothetical protein
VDLVAIMVLPKWEFLKLWVEGWDLFGLLWSYWWISGEDLELTDSFFCQETWLVSQNLVANASNVPAG